jgi:hypothetical protein
MKKGFLIIALLLHTVLNLPGQVEGYQPKGFNFQALARNTAGKLMPRKGLEMRVSLVQRDSFSKNMRYSEIHRVMTDDLGLFSFSIGNGDPVEGKFSEVDWSSGQVWMDLEIKSDAAGSFQLLQRTQLNAVPYAYHSGTANRLSDQPEATRGEKNQSIFWLTSGNSLTKPGDHYVGTRDSQDLVYKTKDISRGKITSDGQLVLEVDPEAISTGTITNSDALKTSYPFTVEGSNNGIYIKVVGSRNGDNKFLSFRDDISNWGAVEGQTMDELKSAWDYKLNISNFTISAATYVELITAGGISAFANGYAALCVAATLVNAWQAPGYTLQAIGDGASTLATMIGASGLSTEIIDWVDNNSKEIGVSYSSGAADYAEWLERGEGERDLQIGEVVGVHAGRVHLKTQGAQRVMIVSTAPAFLGNKPSPEDEHRFEKIAFVGQVNVRVAGPVRSGDYILPSGNNDGLGVAVHPEDMDYDDYPYVAGVAWESVADNPVNMVRVGVGLNRNDLGSKVAGISGKVENILAYLEGKAPLQRAVQSPEKRLVKVPEVKKLMSDEAFDAFLEQNEPLLKSYFAQLDQKIKTAGGDIASDPVLAGIIRDPLTAARAMRRDPKLDRFWGHFDQMILSK